MTAAPTAPGRLGQPLTPAEAQAFLMDLDDWVRARRLELDADPSRAERVAKLATQCERGYADRVILSHDNVAFNNWGAAPPYQPGVYLRIPTVVLPALREHGMSEEEIDMMLSGNPRGMGVASLHARQFSWERSMEELFSRVYRDAFAARNARLHAAGPERIRAAAEG